MISCTEFIPAYSELFTFLEDRYGREEVDRFWEYLFKPDGVGIPLINFLKKEGIKGCYSYWNGSLNEEAADFSMYLNEQAGWFKIQMHRCPSKGRLLELKDTLGIVPYHDYCLHCDHYRESVEQVGLRYIYDFCGVEKASCSILVYDPSRFQNKLIVDENTVQTHRNASDNEYFHRDFHSSLNNAVQYLGEKFGTDVLCDYLRTYTQHVYKKTLEDIRQRGVTAICDHVKETYRLEKSEELLTVEQKNGKTVFTVAYCPAVSHLTATGRTVSEWFPYTTTVMMQVFAEQASLTFQMEEYDAATGRAVYSFS